MCRTKPIQHWKNINDKKFLFQSFLKLQNSVWSLLLRPKLKPVHLLSNSFLPAVTGVRGTRNFDLWLWDSQAKIWWPGKAGVYRVQEDRKGFGLGTSPWVPFWNAFLCQAGKLPISERSVSLYLLPPGQQFLKINLNKNQLWSLLKNAHFQPSFLYLYSWC